MNNVTIPVSLSALSGTTSAPPRAGTPADTVAEAGQAMVESYAAYQDLKVLTSRLNGLPDSAPIPAEIKIDEIVVHFRVDDEPKVIKLHGAQRVGDLYRLLSLETERLIGSIRSHAARASTAAAAVESACSRSQYAANAQQNVGPT